ncbi:MAG: molybdate ABC transporter permease subunit [Desulfamplus sp.]|nr:molybdate ABC transporter permease subunit [Desulfamplus sp.]
MEESALFSIRLSLQVASLSTLIIILSGVPIAYLLARRDFMGKELLDMACTLPLVLPPTVTGYYLVLVFGRNGFIGNFIYGLTGWSIMFTWHAAVLASYVVALPLMIKTSRVAIESVDKNLINASYTLGHSEFATSMKVILPLAKRGIVAGAVLSFARSMGEFGATLMLAGNLPGKTDTMPIAIYSLAGNGEWGKAHIMVFLMTVISGLFLYIANIYSKRIV